MLVFSFHFKLSYFYFTIFHRKNLTSPLLYLCVFCSCTMNYFVILKIYLCLSTVFFCFIRLLTLFTLVQCILSFFIPLATHSRFSTLFPEAVLHSFTFVLSLFLTFLLKPGSIRLLFSSSASSYVSVFVCVCVFPHF